LRTRVYVDGFNFYYGCLKGTSLKWLDLLSLFEKQVLPSITAEIGGIPLTSYLDHRAIKFFTAPILEKAAKANDSLSCQEKYHAALEKYDAGRIELIKGYYSLTESSAKLINSVRPKTWPRDCVDVPIWKLEEKQSDVNLALHALFDAMSGEIEHIVIVTNDTDIAPALQMIRSHSKAVVGLVIPTTDYKRMPNADLTKHAHWVRRQITLKEMQSCQLPRVIADRKRPISKPDSWYARPDLLARAIKLGVEQLGARSKVFQWLNSPNEYWEDQLPLDLLEAGDERVIIFMEKWTSKVR
jgi:6-hydroxy-3-succinoylpyridine 3-monooxygenase